MFFKIFTINFSITMFKFQKENSGMITKKIFIKSINFKEMFIFLEKRKN